MRNVAGYAWGIVRYYFRSFAELIIFFDFYEKLGYKKKIPKNLKELGFVRSVTESLIALSEKFYGPWICL